MAEDFELLRYITIGQYLPGESIVHRLDPAVKLLSAIIVILTVAFLNAYLPKSIQCFLHQSCIILIAADIHAKGHRQTALASDLRRDAFGTVHVNICHNHSCAFLSQTMRAGFPNP